VVASVARRTATQKHNHLAGNLGNIYTRLASPLSIFEIPICLVCFFHMPLRSQLPRPIREAYQCSHIHMYAPLGPEGWSVKHPWRLRVTTNTQRTSAAPWPNAELGIRSLNEGRLNVLYCLEGRSFNKAAPALRRKPLSLNSKLNCFSHSDDIVTRSRAIAFSSEEGFEKLPLIRIKKVR
jgi:hypothetical protein